MTSATTHRSRPAPAVATPAATPAARRLPVRSALRGRVPVPLERLASARLQEPASGTGKRIIQFSRHDMQVAVTIPL